MSIEIVTIPCLVDNYAYIIHDTSTKKNILIDAPELSPILQALDERNWKLDYILITHHHSDHINAVEKLQKEFNSLICGAQKDAERLPKLDISLSDKEKFSVGSLIFKCFEVPGHTAGHIAFYCQSKDILFTGDSLMALGCGRLFEGTPEEMWASLTKLMYLPDSTMIYSGHEYAYQNAKFALSIDSENNALSKRAKEIFQNAETATPNVPVSLELEKSTNPFLRSGHENIKSKLDMFGKNSLEVFTKLREMKDLF